MRKITTLLLFIGLLSACNSAKRSRKFLARGDYNQAIELTVKKISKDPASSKNDELKLLLEEGFERAVEEDLRRIARLKKESNRQREIYRRYVNLDYRQELIRPLIPLYIPSENRNARFELVNYNDDINAAKMDYVAAMYKEAMDLMDRDQVMAYRQAYGLLSQVQELQPGYEDVNAELEDAHYLGTDFVHVTLNNRSGQVLPRRLENELLDFNTYGLDDFWTEYHSQRNANHDYNFGIALNFRSIDISPERIFEKEVRRRKRIKDGWEYQMDANGNVVKDSLGNDIKVDKYINVVATVYITEQSKAVAVGGNVVYRDLPARRDMDNHPLVSEFIFENIFADFRGDERALNDDDLVLIQNDFIPFPSNAQMVLDAGEDIKLRLKDILRNNSLR